MKMALAASSLSEMFRLKVLLVIAMHWTVAIILVFINKQLVSTQHGGRDLIVFIAWSQCVFSVIAIFLATTVQRCFQPQVPWISFPLVTFIHRDTLAMTFTFIGVIVMNNLMLKHIGVAFYQVARSSTLIFTVAFSWVLLGVPVTCRVIMSCLLIILGFVISVDQEILISSLSFVSISYGVLASVSAALGVIFIKRAHRLVNGDSCGIVLINNLNSIFLLFPLMVSTGDLQFTLTPDHFLDGLTWLRLAATGVLSLLVGWASIKVIGLTSPLTHNMSINAKSLLQTLIAVILNGETKTAAWWLGNVLVILGIMNYSFSKTMLSNLKQIEMNVSQPSHTSEFDTRGKKTLLSV